MGNFNFKEAPTRTIRDTQRKVHLVLHGTLKSRHPVTPTVNLHVCYA